VTVSGPESDDRIDVGRERLTVLFNALYDAGEATIPVEHPGEDLGELCRVQLEDAGRCTIEFTCPADDYADRRSTVASTYGEPAITEVPSGRSFVNAFVAGGVLDVANREEVDSFLDRYGSPDLTAGHRPVVAGFDTNLLPWRIADALEVTPGQDGAINGYALATGVRDELVWGQKRKDTRSLVEAFGDPFAELWNQPRGPSREGRLGEDYYRWLRDLRFAEEVPTETGDDEIVDGYDAFQGESRKDVLLFSNDRDFVERARSHRVLAQRVSFPDELPATVTVPWTTARDTLYVLTVLFGVLEVPKTTLYGVWRGKGGTAWHEERLRLDCRSPKLTPAIERDLRIVEAYEGL